MRSEVRSAGFEVPKTSNPLVSPVLTISCGYPARAKRPYVHLSVEVDVLSTWTMTNCLPAYLGDGTVKNLCWKAQRVRNRGPESFTETEVQDVIHSCRR